MIRHRGISSVAVTVLAMLSVGGAFARRVPPTVPTITVTVHEFAFEAPDSIAAGPTTFRFVSRGRQLHVLQLVKLSGGHTMADYNRAYAAHDATPWAANVGGVGTISPGLAAEATLDLAPGLYVFICDIADSDGVPHYVKGMLHQLIVTAGGPVAAMPTPDAVLDLADYSFTFSKPLRAGPQVILVRSVGAQSHMALLWQLHPGKSVTDAMQWMVGGPGSAPMTTIGGVPDLDRGQSAEMVLDLAPGHYMLICLDDDIHDKKPHYAHGMVRDVVIAAK